MLTSDEDFQLDKSFLADLWLDHHLTSTRAAADIVPVLHGLFSR
jgi:hypothetical protein